MTIVSKRNAVLGWLTWNVGKRVVRRKAKRVKPAIEHGRPNRPAIVTGMAAGLAAIGGALLFWRKKRQQDGGGGEAA